MTGGCWHLGRVTLGEAWGIWAASGFCLFPFWGGQAQQPWALIQRLNNLVDLNGLKSLDVKDFSPENYVMSQPSAYLGVKKRTCSGRARLRLLDPSILFLQLTVCC